MAIYNRAAFQAKTTKPKEMGKTQKDLALELANSQLQNNDPRESREQLLELSKEQQTTPEETNREQERAAQEEALRRTREQAAEEENKPQARDLTDALATTPANTQTDNIQTEGRREFGGDYVEESGSPQDILPMETDFADLRRETVRDADPVTTEDVVRRRDRYSDLTLPGRGDLLGTTIPKPGAPMDAGNLPPRLPGAPKEEESIQDLTQQAIRDLLTQAGLDAEEEKQARLEQARVDEAKAIQALRARTGLGGMGLTGAAGALESQLRAEGARGRAITEAELDRAAREEALRRLQIGVGAGQTERRLGIEEEAYGLNIELLEKELDKDINGDGYVSGVGPVSEETGIGDENLENNPEPEEEKMTRAQQDRIYELFQGGSGSETDPYQFYASNMLKLEDAGFEFEGLGERRYKDQYGNYYYFGNQPTVAQ